MPNKMGKNNQCITAVVIKVKCENECGIIFRSAHVASLSITTNYTFLLIYEYTLLFHLCSVKKAFVDVEHISPPPQKTSDDANPGTTCELTNVAQSQQLVFIVCLITCN